MSAAQRAVQREEAIEKRTAILLQLAKIADGHTEPSVRATAKELGNALAAAIDIRITGKRQKAWQIFMARVNQFLKENA